MVQYQISNISFENFMSKRWFRFGFNDARKGLPFRDGWDRTKNVKGNTTSGHSTFYEDGRAFGILYDRDIFKDGHRPTQHALDAFIEMNYDGSIIL